MQVDRSLAKYGDIRIVNEDTSMQVSHMHFLLCLLQFLCHMAGGQPSVYLYMGSHTNYGV